MLKTCTTVCTLTYVGYGIESRQIFLDITVTPSMGISNLVIALGLQSLVVFLKKAISAIAFE